MTKSKSAPKVYSTPNAVLVSGATADEVRKALNLLRNSRPNRPKNAETKIALKFYEISKRFFEHGGRYKKPFTRKNKAPPKKK